MTEYTYLNNISTGFSVKIDNNGYFDGIIRSGLYHAKDTVFEGNIYNLTNDQKIRLEAILESAYHKLDKEFCKAYETLLPNFSGFIVLV
jgi:hypothetical protein